MRASEAAHPLRPAAAVFTIYQARHELRASELRHQLDSMANSEFGHALRGDLLLRGPISTDQSIVPVFAWQNNVQEAWSRTDALSDALSEGSWRPPASAGAE